MLQEQNNTSSKVTFSTEQYDACYKSISFSHYNCTNSNNEQLLSDFEMKVKFCHKHLVILSSFKSVNRFVSVRAIQFLAICGILIKNRRKCSVHVVRSACIFPVGNLMTPRVFNLNVCCLSPAIIFHNHTITISLTQIRFILT